MSERNSCRKVPAIGTFTNKVNTIFTVFAEEAAKTKWKGLRDNFRRELKKIDKPRSGDGAPPHTPRWIHYKALEFLRDVMEPGKTSGNIASPTICIEEPQDSEVTQLNVEQNEVNSTFSEDATSEVQDHSTTLRAPKRKRGRGKCNTSYQEELVRLEKQKLEWLSKQEEEQNDDLNFFRSLVPHIKQLPPTRKLFLRSQFQNMVAAEMTALENK